MTDSRLRLVVFWMVAFGGCQHSAVIDIAARRDETANQQSAAQQYDFDVGQHVGKVVTVEGVLEGDWIYGPSRPGRTFGNDSHKGTQPLRIRYESGFLSLLGVSDDIAKRLADHAGQEVRLQGRIGRIQDAGRPSLPSAQQGYTGPIPGHVIYYLDVASCEPIDRAGIK